MLLWPTTYPIYTRNPNQIHFNNIKYWYKRLSQLTIDRYFELLIGCDTYEWHKIYFNSHILFVSNCDRDQLIICFKVDSCHLKSYFEREQSYS